MPVIGQFTREGDGFIGHLTTLSLPQDIIIVAAEPSDAENAPDFRVHVLDTVSNETGAEIDAGWKRTGEKAGDYVSLQLDDPPSNIRSVQTFSSQATTSPPGVCIGNARQSAASGTERCPPRAISLPPEGGSPSDVQDSFSFLA